MKTTTLQHSKSKAGYDFFYHSQLIFDPAQPGERIYAVLDGEVALYSSSYHIFTLQPGHCLAEARLRHSGWVAVAQSNARLVAIDAATYAAFANMSPSFVLGTIRPLGYKAEHPSSAQIRWPTSMLTRRRRRQTGQREVAQVFAFNKRSQFSERL